MKPSLPVLVLSDALTAVGVAFAHAVRTRYAHQKVLAVPPEGGGLAALHFLDEVAVEIVGVSRVALRRLLALQLVRCVVAVGSDEAVLFFACFHSVATVVVEVGICGAQSICCLRGMILGSRSLTHTYLLRSEN